MNDGWLDEDYQENEVVDFATFDRVHGERIFYAMRDRELGSV